MARYSTIPPNLGPACNPAYLSSGPRGNLDAADDLLFLREMADETHAPHTWGYTIFRATSPSCSDARFDDGLRRLEAWLRSAAQKFYVTTDRDSPGATEALTETAARMWNEIIEDYPGREAVVAGLNVPDGDENFEAVGRAFIAWADDETLGRKDKTTFVVRNDNCLIIDDKALATLEALPAEPPPQKLGNADERRRYREWTRSTWVWILDREYMGRWLNGRADLPALPEWMDPDEAPYPPWARIKICDLYRLWFDRPQKRIPQSGWQLHLEEDRVNPQKVRWRSFIARSANLVRRAMLRGEIPSD